MSAPVHPRLRLWTGSMGDLAVEPVRAVGTVDVIGPVAEVGPVAKVGPVEVIGPVGPVEGASQVRTPIVTLRRRRLAATAALIAVLLLGGAWLEGWRTHVMTTASMGTAAPVGTLVISEPTTASAVRVGQILVFHPPGQPNITFAHRVTHIAHTPTGLQFDTRGDIDGSADPWVLSGANLIGRVVLRIPVAGFALEMLPAALAALLLIILITVSMRPAWRRPARILLSSLAAGFLLFYYHPLADISLIAQSVNHGDGVASVVPTGILPVRISAVGGTHVNLSAGHVGTVHVGHLPVSRRFALNAHIHLMGWWWLVLLAWAVPVLVSLRPSRFTAVGVAEVAPQALVLGSAPETPVVPEPAMGVEPDLSVAGIDAPPEVTVAREPRTDVAAPPAHGSGSPRRALERGPASRPDPRRSPIRAKRHPKLQTAFLVLACSIFCWRRIAS